MLSALTCLRRKMSFSSITPAQSGFIDFNGANANGQGSVAGTEDIAQGATLLTGRTLAGTYNISTHLDNGRGVMQLTSPNAAKIAFWVIDDREMVGISLDPSDSSPYDPAFRAIGMPSRGLQSWHSQSKVQLGSTRCLS